MSLNKTSDERSCRSHSKKKASSTGGFATGGYIQSMTAQVEDSNDSLAKCNLLCFFKCSIEFAIFNKDLS